MKKSFVLPVLLLLTFFSAKSQDNASAFVEHFGDSGSPYFRYGSTGTKAAFKWQSGKVSSIEPKSEVLSFRLDPADSAGAGRGPEIISNKFTHFGTYSTRLKVPDVRKIQPNVGAVVGYFTYHMDSVAGLSEIDFEWLIADPTVIYIGTWTGPRGALKRIGRTINLKEGIIYQTAFREGHRGASVPLTGLQSKPDSIAAIPDYDASARFYTYGFDWYPDQIRWWMIHPATGEKLVLWHYQGSQVGIPQNKSLYRMNFWHTKDWAVETNPNSPEAAPAAI